MDDEELPSEETDLNEVNSALNEGLQTCRSVLANYRTLLTGAETAGNDNDPEEDGDSVSE